MTSTIYVGDCREVLRTMAADSVDSIVTDPPYHLTTQVARGPHAPNATPSTPHGRHRIGDKGFMGKAWDGGDVAFQPATWAEALRVAKPGAYLIAFGGSRTHHRLACAIEDAGWEIRDTIMWLYGSGFPKSKNLGDGRGTALKPAHEPIILARKPMVGTVARNVEVFGTGVLNIDACRIPTDEQLRAGAGGIPCRNDERSARTRYADRGATDFAATPGPRGGDELGRWPANVIHDGSPEVLADFPDAPGQPGDLAGHSRNRTSRGVYGDMRAARDAFARSDAGSAARFFYCAKASASDREAGLEGFDRKPSGQTSETSGQHITRRDGYELPLRANTHPTVKPTSLMRYLCRLITPPGGTIADLFTGSGSTGRGAVLEGFSFLGIEIEAESAAIAEARIADARAEYEGTNRQLALALKESAA